MKELQLKITTTLSISVKAILLLRIFLPGTINKTLYLKLVQKKRIRTCFPKYRDSIGLKRCML